MQINIDTLDNVAAGYKNNAAIHQHIHAAFTRATENDAALLRHRQHVESHKLGFGDRAFHWLWKLIVDTMPARFSFLEIGVYKGQVLSLVGMLAQQAGKLADIHGVSPLDTTGDKFSNYEPNDYAALIAGLQEWAGLPRDRQARLIQGLSTDEDVKQICRTRGPMDVVYIDGGHDFHVVVNDIVTYRDLVRPGGLLLMDDASTRLDMPPEIWPGHADVSRAVEEVLQRDDRFTELLAVGHLRVWRKQGGAVAAQPALPHIAAPIIAPAVAARWGKPNLVMGLCSGYSFAQIEGFVASLLNLHGNIELYLFATNMDETFYDVARRFGIGVCDPSGRLVADMHPMFSRFLMYQDFLATEGSRYGKVMLTDVRDVFFQSDPFAVPFGHEVCFAAEDTRIGRDPINSKWVEDVAGPAVVAEIADRNVSCAGTILGTVDGINRYLATMRAQMIALNVDVTRNLDQALHNYVVSKLQPDWGALDLEDRLFNTVGCTSPDRIEITGNHVLVDGAVPPVIHQWDRHGKLAAYVAASFRVDGVRHG